MANVYYGQHYFSSPSFMCIRPEQRYGLNSDQVLPTFHELHNRFQVKSGQQHLKAQTSTVLNMTQGHP